MFYKTLHTYILRELLRIFILTASAITTLLSFGGIFKPLTKQGLDLGQLMLVMVISMPAMLAYAIPMAALFAAVQVYWRMSTDNEVVACRAGGISFFAVLMPALVLGLAVAVTDFAFVNFVVPLFLQKVEQVVRRDIGSVLQYNVSHQESFQFGPLVVYADAARLVRTKTDTGADRSIVILNGMAATQLDKTGKPTRIIVAQRAAVNFDENARGDASEVWIQLEDGAAYDPLNFRKMGASINRFPPVGKPYEIPSALRDKPKFMNIRQLKELVEHPDQNSAVRALLDKMHTTWEFQKTAENLALAFRPGVPLVFDSGIGDVWEVTAPAAILTPERTFTVQGTPQQPVKVAFFQHGKERYYYLAEGANFTFLKDDYSDSPPTAMLQLYGKNIKGYNLVQKVPMSFDQAPQAIQLTLPPAMIATVKQFDVPAILAMQDQFSPAMSAMVEQTRAQVQSLMQYIESERHSRVSFSVSCLTLVLLGAALGIQLRGRNPLAVFVLGFVPAIVLVMLITAGRQMVETGNPSAVNFGFWVIWSGNGIILAMVAVVYQKLLRQ